MKFIKGLFTKNIGLKIMALLAAVILWIIVLNVDDPIQNVTFRGIPVEIVNTDEIIGENKIYSILDNSDQIAVKVYAKRSIIDLLDTSDIKATADLNNITLADTVKIDITSNRFSDEITRLETPTENLKLRIEDRLSRNFLLKVDIEGDLQTDYIIGNIVTDQNQVRISGAESIVSRISTVSAPIEVNETITSDIMTEVDLVLHDYDGGIIPDHEITKNISQVKINVEILKAKTVPVTVGYQGEVAQGYIFTGITRVTPTKVTIVGKPRIIDGIKEIEIPENAVDLSGLTERMTLSLPLSKYLPGGVSVQANEPETVTVALGIEAEAQRILEISRSQLEIINIPADFSEDYQISLDDDKESYEAAIYGTSSKIAEVLEYNLKGTIDLEQWYTSLTEEVSDGKYKIPIAFSMPEGVEMKEVPEALIDIWKKGR